MSSPSPKLIAIPFAPEMVTTSMVQQFHCGDRPWECEISDWLKREHEGASDDMTIGGCIVWLFLNQDHVLIGVGAIGPHTIHYPKPNSPKIPTCCITNLGVDHRHHRKGYGQVILDHLLAEARERYGEIPIIAYVFVDNPALTWYTEKNGFKPFGKPTKTQYQKIVLDLRSVSTPHDIFPENP
ncbi:MAG: GNAT family N-acetyltransferase [Gemmataceae bacterium]